MKDFAEEDAVIFGDINLREKGPRTGPNGGSLESGKGGWPTIRYFNTETGYDGGAYEKQTKAKMCDELGPKMNYMNQYIENYGLKAKAEGDSSETGGDNSETSETSAEEKLHDEL